MKAILYALAILVAGGAAFFSYSQSVKFKDVQNTRLSTIANNKEVTDKTDVADKKIKDEKALLAASQDKQESLKQSVETLKATGLTLKNDEAKIDTDLAAQDVEFAQLDKALQEVKSALADLGQDITFENLPEKIAQIEQNRDEKKKKLDELETLVSGAEKDLATKRTESDRLVTRSVERSARINRNAMQAVVTAVNQDWGFLVIGAGSNSGFTPQTALIVKRDGRTIGRVRPSSIEPTQTIAEIDFDSLATGVHLQPGDHVILAKPNSN